jgi:deazaflavin-dependent oxidoreductase (nitroreductase family)
VQVVPSDLSLKAVNRLHRLMLKVTGGRVGSDLRGMGVVQLTTTGRRSGQPRTVMLTSPLQEGDTIVVVASRGGDDQMPAWLLNIQADPRVEVGFRGRPAQPRSARVASPEERARLWPLVVERQPHYGGYQRKTEREVPLVLLEPPR